MKRYGIMSDFHKLDPKYFDKAFDYLKNNDVDELILNGNLIGDKYKGLDTSDYFKLLLSSLVRSGLKTYVLPGEYETVSEFESIIRFFQQYSPNIHYVLDEPFVDQHDHHLIFLPGADNRIGRAKKNGYSLDSKNISKYISYPNYKKNELFFTKVSFIGNLEKLVKDPKISILVSHIPMKFSNPHVAVDMAKLWRVKEDFNLNGILFNKNIIIPNRLGLLLKNKGYPVYITAENRGNQDLAKIIQKLELRKHISGHFHESVHRAHDYLENSLNEGEWNKQLFFNASYVDIYKLGIIDVNADKVRFYKVTL